MPQLYKKEDPRRKKTFVRKLSVYDKKSSINSVNRLAWKYIDNHALFYCRISTNRSRHSNPELIIMMIIPKILFTGKSSQCAELLNNKQDKGMFHFGNRRSRGTEQLIWLWITHFKAVLHDKIVCGLEL